MTQILRFTLAMILAAGLVAPSGALAQDKHSNPETDRIRNVADRLEIIELSAHFDNALDSENITKFAGVFADGGTLSGFWGNSTGDPEIRKAFTYMLATFSKHKRHVVTNHEITIKGDRASMYCYLTVFDRDTLAVTGTATFTDDLVRTPMGWRFEKRTLKADPNVDPIIERLSHQSSTN